MTAKRIYAVTPKVQEAGKEVTPRLIRAATQAQVGRHLAGEVNITVASQEDDCIAAASAGVQVEEAGEEPKDTQQKLALETDAVVNKDWPFPAGNKTKAD